MIDPTILTGHWELRRRLVDHVAGLHATVLGTMNLRPAADGTLALAWSEQGLLSWAGRSVPVSRTYLLQPGADGWSVLFEHGGLFHPWQPDRWVEHPCRDDVYRGIVRVDGNDRMRVVWDVLGPAKRQRIVTRLRRRTDCEGSAKNH